MSIQDDGLHLPRIKAHSLEKLRRHQLYTSVFARRMAPKWRQLAYIGLYCGAGRAMVDDTGEIVETAPLSVLRLSPGFTHHIFVDRDPQCTSALRQRVVALGTDRSVEILTGDVNTVAPQVRRLLPRYTKEKGLLSLCFVDPFAADVHFATMRALADLRMDFLVLLMLGVDSRRNFRKYCDDPTSTRIADLIDDPHWRSAFGNSPPRQLIPFLLRKYDQAMVRLGYRSASEKHYHRVTVSGKNVLQYILVLYSKHDLGQQFWEECLAAANPQSSLGL